MSDESEVEPIELGDLFDFTLPSGFPQEQRDDLLAPVRMVFLHAFADAHPLTPRGVNEALERVKMCRRRRVRRGPTARPASGRVGAGWVPGSSWRVSSTPTQ